MAMGSEQIFYEVLKTLNLEFIVLIAIGTFIGLIVGALPGLTTTMGIALLTGITFKFSGHSAIALLMGLYVGGVSGGSLSGRPDRHSRHTRQCRGHARRFSSCHGRQRGTGHHHIAYGFHHRHPLRHRVPRLLHAAPHQSCSEVHVGGVLSAWVSSAC